MSSLNMVSPNGIYMVLSCQSYYDKCHFLRVHGRKLALWLFGTILKGPACRFKIWRSDIDTISKVYFRSKKKIDC